MCQSSKAATSTNYLVTVLMSTYNADNYLCEAIDSILNQTLRNFEFIIINDGSTDSTTKILDSYNDPRIIVINNSKRMGLVFPLIHGFKLARSEYIVRMDSDDISLPSRLEKLYQYMEANPDCGVCGSAIKKFGKNNKIKRYPLTNEEITSYLLWDNAFAHPSVILRKKSFINNNLNYRHDYNSAADYRLWIECVPYFKMANLNEVLLKYRIHNTQTGTIKNDEQQKFTDLIRLEYARDNLNFSLEELEESPHLTLANCPCIESEEELKLIADWINKLLAANSKIGRFNSHFFCHTIARRWARLCRRSSLSYKVVWPIFSTCSINSYCTVVDKLRFWVTTFGNGIRKSLTINTK